MMRVELGVLSNGRLGPVEIVSEYIQNKQELEVGLADFIFFR